ISHRDDFLGRRNSGRYLKLYENLFRQRRKPLDERDERDMIRLLMSRRSGFTLLEVVIFGTISCVVIFCMAQFLTKPYQMQHLLSSSETPPEAAHAMDLFVNDLKEAVPGSTQWEVLTSTMPLAFSKTRENSDTGKYEPYLVGYGYEGPEKGPGTLVRVEDSSSTVLLS